MVACTREPNDVFVVSPGAQDLSEASLRAVLDYLAEAVPASESFAMVCDLRDPPLNLALYLPEILDFARDLRARCGARQRCSAVIVAPALQPWAECLFGLLPPTVPTYFVKTEEEAARLAGAYSTPQRSHERK
jgi:hypothetical protein